jgi:hypothetical protein
MYPQLPDFLVRTILICSVYMLLFLAVRHIIYPLQQMIAPDAAQYAAFIFLPHGVRVIATWLYREKAIVPLLLAHLVLYRLFYWQGGDAALNIVAVLSGSLCVFITMQLFSFSRIDISLRNMTISHWRSLVFLGFISSVFNTAGNMLAMGDTMGSELHLEVIATFIIGDTVGTLACLFILMLGFRLHRLAKAD